MHLLRTTLFLSVLGAGGVASANGFYINEHDAKVTGRAGASTATDTDASAVVFNPGGIAVNKGTQVTIGAALIIAQGSYTDKMDQKTDTDSGPAVLPTIFATSRVHDMVSVGIGFHLPFGLAISWPETSPQRDVLLKQSLRTYFITPSVGINLNKQVPGLSIGAGVDLVPATVEIERAIVFGDTTGRAHLGGDAFGIGGRFGVMYHPPALKQLQVGAMFRAPLDLEFSGKGDFDIDPPYRDQLPPDGDITTTLKLPMAVAAGVSYDVLPELQLELNAVYQTWSRFKEIRINLPGDVVTVQPQDYKDTVTIRFGAEYALPKQHAAVRVGYAYDPTPIPSSTVSASLPDADRHVITAGGSYTMGNYDLHLGLLWVTPSEQDAAEDPAQPTMPTFKGTYGVQAFVASLSLTGRFGK
jgi:long-chain fatty acid transport protein